MVAQVRSLTAAMLQGGRATAARWTRPRTGTSLVLWIGVVLFAAASAVDIVFHLLPQEQALLLSAILGPEARLAHLATTAGMALILVGVVHRGITASRSGERAASTHPNDASLATPSTHSKEA